MAVKQTKNASKQDDILDGRKRWSWESMYPDDAKILIRCEAYVLLLGLIIVVISLIFTLGFDQKTVNKYHITVDLQLVSIFFVGCMGGVAYSMKWLMHSVAKGMWHSDRRLWRYFSPILAGVYTMAVFHIGFFAWANTTNIDMETYGIAFLIGYFGDGISAALTNVARAILGTVHG